LRAGNTHASNSSVAILKRIVCALRDRWPEVAIEIRADAGFAIPALYDYCEKEGISYTIALITNERLKQIGDDLLEEAREERERTDKKATLFGEDLYAAASWEHARRVIYKAEAMEQGTNRRFVVSSRPDAPKELYEFYAQRGEAENWIKDFKVHMKADRLSCHRFVANQFQAVVACRGLLADGCLEEEAHGEWGAQGAAGHFEAFFDQDRREGRGTVHEDPTTSGHGASGARFMAHPFGSFRSRS
jgi:hypothetical protein